VLSIALLESCKKNETDNFKPNYLNFTVPNGWPQPNTNIFANNALTQEGFDLGKKLFYDGKLSKDGEFPCASCHEQYVAFATFDHDLSHGYNNSFTTRNTPPTFNLAWSPLMHWDGGAANIETEAITHITANNEMGETMDDILVKLKNDPDYPAMFKAAFGGADITTQRMLKALAQFTGSIVSNNAKYDKVQRGEATFTTSEQNGYNLFKAKCNVCHTEPLFTDNSFRNNGLALNNTLLDVGRKKITNLSADSLKFKVPTLRNVELTSPYMHDGRIFALSQVLDHYSSGIITTQPTLDPLLANRISLTTSEKFDLKQFLYSLTDTALTKNVRYKKP
jgi:cytochrome c peroxidase